MKPRSYWCGGGAVALGLASAVYQTTAEARDRRTYPPPGHLIGVGRRRLHIVAAGDGTPAVVIIPAMGGSVLSWLGVVRTLAGTTTAAGYDRAGLGWSDPPTGLPTAAGMAADLRTLLQGAGIGPPYVLAGHSLGGLIAQMFTYQHPDDVPASG